MRILTPYWFRNWSFLALLGCSTILVGFGYFSYRPPYTLYSDLTTDELQAARNFLQEQVDPKFVLFKQLQGAGFNNQVQEILLYHHLSQISSRIYAYQPFIWRSRNHQRLPLSAFLPGPTKKAIPQSLFEEICPPEAILHVTIPMDSYDEVWGKAQEVLAQKDRCIQIDNWILNWNFLASSAIHKIWPAFQHYLSRYFEWSPQIQVMVERAQKTLNLRSLSSNDVGEPYMALHIRRGDFPEHCKGLAEDQVGFTTWATLPAIKDSVLPPELSPRNRSSVIEHCYSSLWRIMEAIDAQAKRNPRVRALHVLHDGAIDHLNVYLDLWKLETAVMDTKRARRVGWPGGPMKLFTHTGQIPVHRGELDFAVAVDVELARQADVFIGNGYSSLSSQIVALRLATEAGKAEDITLL
ncbi:hypothetical protein VNI00_007397 [Paramarasmius palmivorus]|uniref:O-fucosyltransferase family protein n=1 Tax=Paramarasmius palmivorus TaxID=297713 RepID=A0AAW0D3I9_9AGAR